MHSSRMCTARLSAHLGGGGICLGGVCPGGVCLGGVCPGDVCLGGGLPRGIYLGMCVNRITDRCKNITLQKKLRFVCEW